MARIPLCFFSLKFFEKDPKRAANLMLESLDRYHEARKKTKEENVKKQENQNFFKEPYQTTQKAL